MKQVPLPAQLDPGDEISALIDTLFATEQRLEELTAGEVDTVAGRDGRTFLLARAQDQLRLKEAAKDAAIALTLQRQHTELRVLFDLMPAMVWFKDTENRILRVNRRVAEASGRTVEEIEGKSTEEIYPKDAAKYYADDLEVIHSRAPKLGIIEVMRDAKGGERWVQTDKVPVLDKTGNVTGVVVVALDITERKRADDALRMSEKRFKALFEQAAVGVAQTDAATGRFVQINQRFCEIVGRSPEEMKQLTFTDVTHPSDVDRGVEMMRQLKVGLVREFTYEKRYLKKGGAEVWVNVTVSAMWAAGETPDFFLVVGQDITERKRLEDQFRQAQKMDAMGTLAGGIAHDFNNILAAISGYTELSVSILEEKREEHPNVRSHLGAVLQATGRATHLVRQILTFSRQQPVERRSIALLPVVAEALTLLRATIPSTIEFETALPSNAPAVLADASQVHQILMNLGTNAWHAMKDRTGLLKVTLERCVVDSEHAAAQPGLRPGVYARVSVSDSGSGMDQATLSRIFDPFFTTKPRGEGTGLGLSVVHGIMDAHDGTITVSSQPGEGSVFHLYFPAHSGDAAVLAPEASPPPRGSGERILYVDDEELLVQLGQQSLATLGYEVETTTQPAAALALVRADPQRFDLVITDQTMPQMTGLALATELRQIRPDLPVILVTGYSHSLTPKGVEAAGLRQLLIKPFTIYALGEAVSAALHAQSSR